MRRRRWLRYVGPNSAPIDKIAKAGRSVVGNDDLLAAIETVHAAGLDDTLWPQALGAITRIVGGVGATLEVVEKSTTHHRLFHAFGPPAAHTNRYMHHYATINPRLPVALRQRAGEASWDYMVFDDQGMDRHPFYTEFLSSLGLRYQLCVALANTPREFAAFTVQRTRRQGHVGQAEVRLAKRLFPHVRQALDVTTRLREATGALRSLESALDWLTEGVALLGLDGKVLHANEALQAIVRRRDGIRLDRQVIEFGDLQARNALEQAIGAIRRLADGDAGTTLLADFLVARSDGPPYVVSVRPLATKGSSRSSSRAVAIVFLRDPLSRNHSGANLLRTAFGLTPAEADLAQALQSGIPLGRYAEQRSVSLNTVYTHLRGIKAKTSSSRMTELIRKLNDLQAGSQWK
jgi:DNA-binding CsgD family transcriptional regulator